jgi:hypothetical protein
LRTAGLLALVTTFGALWIAFVMNHHADPPPAWSLSWLPPPLAVVLLVGVLHLAGLMLDPGRVWGTIGARRRPAVDARMFAAALVAVAAMLGLVHALNATLWLGPAWRRWAIVGLASAGVVAASGRAWVWALLGALALGALGLAAGLGGEPPGVVDLIPTGVLVGATLGAVAGTLLTRDHRR